MVRDCIEGLLLAELIEEGKLQPMVGRGGRLRMFRVAMTIAEVALEETAGDDA